MTDDLTRKTFHLKALSTEGEFQAVISTDAVDRDGEIVARDAFRSSLGKTIPLIQSHDWGSLPVGKGVVGQDSEGTTLAGSFFLDTAGGQEAYKTAKNMADLQEFSIGFMPLAAENVTVDGKTVRKITDLELFEASLVLVGASRGTRLAGIKTAEPANEDATPGRSLTAILAEIGRLAGAKAAEKQLSDAELGQFHDALQQFSDLHAGVCDMGADCPMLSDEPQKNSATDHERKLRELEAALGYRPLIAGQA